MPRLIAIDGLPYDIDCERTPTHGCRYRVEKRRDDVLVGVCEEGRCSTREFSREELTRYTVNARQLRRDLATLLDLTHDDTEPAHPRLLPIGIARVSRQSAPVVLVGASHEELAERLAEEPWLRGEGRFAVLIPSRANGCRRLLRFLDKIGWPWFVLEDHVIWGPEGALAFEEGCKAAWQSVIEEATRPGRGVEEQQVIGEAVVRIDRNLAAVAAGVTGLQADNSRLEDENRVLKGNLVTVLKRIASQVDPDFFRQILVILGTGTVSGAAKVLGMSESTLRLRMEQARAKDGLYRGLHDLVKREKRGRTKGDVVRLDPMALDSIGSSAGTVNDVDLEQVAELLGKMHDGNFKKIRDVLLEMIDR